MKFRCFLIFLLYSTNLFSQNGNTSFSFLNVETSPRSIAMGGNLISSVIGVTSFKMAQLGLYDLHYAIPISVSLATMAMLKTDTVHPPAGGTAMIAALGAEPVASLGYQLIIPTIFGSSFLMSSSLIFNKILKKI